jgi:hypothetical protein
MLVSPFPTATEDPLRATATAAFADGVTYDLLNRFSIRLLLGWHAVLPRPEASMGIATFQNYSPDELEASRTLPPDLVFIRITTYDLLPESTIDQWLIKRRQEDTSPYNGVPEGTSLTEAEPIKIGRYDGVSYYSHGPDGDTTQLIYLHAVNPFVLGIGVYPAMTIEAGTARFEPNARFFTPQWRRMTRDEVEALIEGPIS